MDIKKSLATKEGRIKLLQEIVKEATALPQDKELNKLMEFCNVLVKAFTSPPQAKKGAFMALQMQVPKQKSEKAKDDLATAIAAVTKGTASDKETITADNLKKTNDNDKD